MYRENSRVSRDRVLAARTGALRPASSAKQKLVILLASYMVLIWVVPVHRLNARCVGSVAKVSATVGRRSASVTGTIAPRPGTIRPSDRLVVLLRGRHQGRRACLGPPTGETWSGALRRRCGSSASDHPSTAAAMESPSFGSNTLIVISVITLTSCHGLRCQLRPARPADEEADGERDAQGHSGHYLVPSPSFSARAYRRTRAEGGDFEAAVGQPTGSSNVSSPLVARVGSRPGSPFGSAIMSRGA